MTKERKSADIARQIPESYYDNYYGLGIGLTSENAYWNCAKFLEEVCAVMPFKCEDTTFVDLGAGTGAIVKLMQEFGIKADGYELNTYALKNAEVELIERDITKPLLKKYDIAYSNAFMYMTSQDIRDFFINNYDKFNALVMVYPFEGNNDKNRVELKDKRYFKEMGELFGFIVYDIDEGKLIMVREK